MCITHLIPTSTGETLSIRNVEKKNKTLVNFLVLLSIIVAFWLKESKDKLCENIGFLFKKNLMKAAIQINEPKWFKLSKSSKLVTFYKKNTKYKINFTKWQIIRFGI